MPKPADGDGKPPSKKKAKGAKQTSLLAYKNDPSKWILASNCLIGALHSLGAELMNLSPGLILQVLVENCNCMLVVLGPLMTAPK
jgi:hypothetical protein